MGRTAEEKIFNICGGLMRGRRKLESLKANTYNMNRFRMGVVR
jgi:hypothetical protein